MINIGQRYTIQMIENHKKFKIFSPILQLIHTISRHRYRNLADILHEKKGNGIVKLQTQ